MNWLAPCGWIDTVLTVLFIGTIALLLIAAALCLVVGLS